MKKQFLSSIQDFLSEKITDKSAVFVFTTDVVCQSWADWCVLDNHTSVKSVASSRFLAWDKFKGKFVSAQKEGYSAVPSLLRKMFVYDLIRKNVEKRIFKKIINPAEEYAKDAYSFADWITANLPSLHLWKKRLEKNLSEYGQLDEEDEDYKLLYNLYSEFLEEHKLFEPSWIDEINLSDTQHHYYIFYPEQLEDFLDFEEIFAKAGNVTALCLNPETPAPLCYEYSDARTELRKTILRMAQIVKSKKADWSEIALSVPDFATYRPYLERELNLYSVPFVIRAGSPLTKNCAGRIFKEISDCHGQEFSFDSVRTLLLDETLPWKEEYKQLKEDLIREGNRMRCICPFPEENDGSIRKIDVWELALLKTSDKKSETNKGNYNLLKFYEKIRGAVNQFFQSEMTFAGIMSAWNIFKNDFLNANDFTSEDFFQSNLILSRCIKHLQEIIQLENQYSAAYSTDGKGLKVDSPFQFFIEYIDSKTYTPQQEISGLNVFDYKLTASAFYKYQFVINASQKKIDVQKKRLSFLSSKKRAVLGFEKDDAMQTISTVVSKLYAKTTEACTSDFVHFSYCIDSFAGFAIPHSSLNIIEEKDVPEPELEDYVLAQKKWVKNGGAEKVKITQTQASSFASWKKSAVSGEKEPVLNNQLKKNIEYVLKENRAGLTELGANPEKISVSARGDMEQFFPCPRKWLLKKVLKLQEDSLDTQLMQKYDMGNINHKILEEFISLYKGKKLPWFMDGSFYEESEQDMINAAPKNVTEKIYELIYTDIVNKAIHHKGFEFSDSPIVLRTLESQKMLICDLVWNCLKKLLLPFNDDGSEKDINGIGKCTVHGVEESFVKAFEEFNLFGNLDCLVLTPDGDYVILDYKNTSGSIPAKKDMVPDDAGILNDFQMAVYANLLKDRDNRKLAAAYFFPIKWEDEKTRKVSAFDEKNPNAPYSSFEPAVTAAQEYAGLFAERISEALNNKDVLVPHTSKNMKDKLNVNRYTYCSGCSFKSICRTTYTVGKKELPEA